MSTDIMMGGRVSTTVTTVPMAAPTIADDLTAKAKSRIAEIQKKLDEVPALEAELSRLRRMVDAAEGK